MDENILTYFLKFKIQFLFLIRSLYKSFQVLPSLQSSRIVIIIVVAISYLSLSNCVIYVVRSKCFNKHKQSIFNYEEYSTHHNSIAIPRERKYRTQIIINSLFVLNGLDWIPHSYSDTDRRCRDWFVFHSKQWQWRERQVGFILCTIYSLFCLSLDFVVD